MVSTAANESNTAGGVSGIGSNAAGVAPVVVVWGAAVVVAGGAVVVVAGEAVGVVLPCGADVVAGEASPLHAVAARARTTAGMTRRMRSLSDSMAVLGYRQRHSRP